MEDSILRDVLSPLSESVLVPESDELSIVDTCLVYRKLVKFRNDQDGNALGWLRRHL